ncbi:uncharacterized protein LOC131022962 [Salvia miltiorrhiza]|uniref:uncharacterized protein LOC131022962 n=1 Tax=Salvia miltiorrhiza TaxID=226208 RepID=UPI0025AC58CB|nr:uncharacterized protein LOC131022962 [Salvia miltiorrhiza]
MLNPAKCTFGVFTGKFLGYKVTPAGIEVNTDKVKAIMDMTPPKGIKEVQTLNGRITALSRFISRSAERSLPFFKILRKGTKFQWTAECRTAFDDLKAYLAELPTLTKPIPGEVFYLYIAVGEESISSALIREEGNHQRPIYFVNRVIQGPELNYTEIEKAALAVMVTARKLRPYFLSHRVVVRTALPFRQVLGRPDLSGRMVKWAVELGEYDVEYEPRMAIKVQALADFIQETTRRPAQEFWIAFVDGSVTKEGCGIGVYVVSPSSELYQFAIKFTCRMSNNEAEYEVVVRAAHTLSELRAECVIIRTDSQLVAQQFSGGYHIKEDRMRPYHNKINEMKTKFMEFKIEQISREENTKADLLARVASAVEQTWSDEITLLCDTREMGTSQVFAVEIRDDWRAPIIHILKTGERLNKESNQRARYENYCLINDQLYKRSFTHPLLKCLSPEEANFALKEIHVGCCGGHTEFRDLIRKIIRVGFYWPNITKDAREFVCKCKACQRHAGKINIPGEIMGIIIIVSDNGTQFTGQRIADFCDRMDITQRFVTVAHSQANGQVELANRSICEGIKKQVNQSRGKWVEELDTVLWAYRTSPKTATGEPPFTLVYGSNAVVPTEARLESYRITTYNTEQNSELRRAELDLVKAQRNEAQVRAAKYKSIIKARYDKRVRARKLSKGDLVLKKADALKLVGKFEPNWEGPFIITEVLGGEAYTLVFQPRREASEERQEGKRQRNAQKRSVRGTPRRETLGRERLEEWIKEKRQKSAQRGKGQRNIQREEPQQQKEKPKASHPGRRSEQQFQQHTQKNHIVKTRLPVWSKSEEPHKGQPTRGIMNTSTKNKKFYSTQKKQLSYLEVSECKFTSKTKQQQHDSTKNI